MYIYISHILDINAIWRPIPCEDWGVNVQPYSGSPANFAVPRQSWRRRCVGNEPLAELLGSLK